MMRKIRAMIADFWGNPFRLARGIKWICKKCGKTQDCANPYRVAGGGKCPRGGNHTWTKY